MRAAQIVGFLPLFIVLTGCGQNDIRVYRVPKEAPPAQEVAQAQPSAIPPGHPDISGAPQSIKWKVPPRWEEAPLGDMRTASFRIKGENGKQAEVSVVALGGVAGGDLNNVNRWRVQQLGLSPVSEAELGKLAEPVEIGGQPAKLYELAGKGPTSGNAERILGAIQHREGTAWFFKMTGDDALVAEQKPAFVEFMKSFTFPVASAKTDLPPSHPPIDPGALASAAAPARSQSDGSKPIWNVPKGWQETSGQFLVAKFLITGPDKTQAAVNVSDTGGGIPANVNRWRNQLGLSPLAQDDLDKQMRPLALNDGKAMLIDMTGTDPNTMQKVQLVGVIFPQPDHTWYYKLMGNPKLVQQQKDAFINFVKSAKYP